MEQRMVRSRLRALLAQRNAERAERQEPEITIRQLAEDIDLSPSVITGLTGKRSQGVQFETLNKLCAYFECQPGDILVYEPDKKDK